MRASGHESFLWFGLGFPPNKGCLGSFPFSQNHGLKFRKFSMSKGNAFSILGKKLLSLGREKNPHVVVQEVSVSASSRNYGNFVQMGGIISTLPSWDGEERRRGGEEYLRKSSIIVPENVRWNHIFHLDLNWLNWKYFG